MASPAVNTGVNVSRTGTELTVIVCSTYLVLNVCVIVTLLFPITKKSSFAGEVVIPFETKFAKETSSVLASVLVSVTTKPARSN